MKSRFQRVAVLKGGPSAEREVSLRSGAAVANGLCEAGYDVTEIDVTEPKLNLPVGIDAVFIALHGEYGEDGQVQAELDALGVPYTGSGSEASRRCFDKILTKEAFMSEGIPTARYQVMDGPGDCPLPFPVVVKPPAQGSSLGVRRVDTAGQWPAALASVFKYDSRALVEEFISGRELTVGIVGDQVLPIVEIVAPEGDYSYEAKYTTGASRYEVPALLPGPVMAHCQALALAAYRGLNCRGMGRVDFRLPPVGPPSALEVNTIPGFTETSLLPMAAGKAGIGFSSLCSRILNTAVCAE